MNEDYKEGFKQGDIVSLAVDWEGGNLSFGVNGVMGKSLPIDTRVFTDARLAIWLGSQGDEI
jgi:hypothetical protein